MGDHIINEPLPAVFYAWWDTPLPVGLEREILTLLGVEDSRCLKCSITRPKDAPERVCAVVEPSIYAQSD